MARNTSSLKTLVLVFNDYMKEKLLKDESSWIGISNDCEVELVQEIAPSFIFEYAAVLVVGGEDKTEELPRLSKSLLVALWKFASEGGILYGEMLHTLEYPSSRLFGFQQDFAPAQEYLQKLRNNNGETGLDEGRLVQWDGAFVPGFAIDSAVILQKSEFRETHFSSYDQGLPVFLRKLLGSGVVFYSAIPLLSSKKQWMYRPYSLWKKFILYLQKEGLPVKTGRFPVEISQEPSSFHDVLRNGFDWFLKSGILPAESGLEGLYENIHSHHSELTKDFRPDCHSQTALAFYLHGEYSGDDAWIRRSYNLIDFIIDNGFQDEDKTSKSYGFWKWFDFPSEYPKQIFTDDNSWVAFVLLYIGRKSGNKEYIRRGLLTVKALLNTQHFNGLRPEQLDRDRLEAEPNYLEKMKVSFNPHFESICHAAFLQAYIVSENSAYLQVALKGMATLRENKTKWCWMYSRTAALARYLFPLSLALQLVEDRETIHEEFYWTINQLRQYQNDAGAIEETENPDPERFGTEDTGVFIHDGEMISDLLYTNNFLLLNLWEGWKATEDEEILDFYNELNSFLRKVQIKSKNLTFDGAWMRAFDLNMEEYYGNLGDTGWGPYCIEGGWTQAIILVGLLVSQLDTSLVC